MKCAKCENRERQYKNGKTKAGSQRYRCGNCGYSYTPRKKPKGTAKLSVKKRSRCISTDQASEARDGSLVFIIKAWRIGQKNKLNNCLKRQYLQPSKPQSSMRFLLLLVIKKPYLPDYPCGSRNSLLFGLESGVGAFPRTRASHC